MRITKKSHPEVWDLNPNLAAHTHIVGLNVDDEALALMRSEAQRVYPHLTPRQQEIAAIHLVSAHPGLHDSPSPEAAKEIHRPVDKHHTKMLWAIIALLALLTLLFATRGHAEPKPVPVNTPWGPAVMRAIAARRAAQIIVAPGANFDASGNLNVNCMVGCSGGGSGGNVTIVGPLGQQLAAASIPVVLTAAQISTLTPLSTITANQGTSPWVTSVSGSVAVTGTFWQTTQPVSGTFWQATQPVSGTFWQTTQPVSGTFFQASQPVTIVDGGSVTLGSKADAKSTATDTTAITIMQVLKELSALEQAPVSRAVTNAGTFAVQDATVEGAITSSVMQQNLKQVNGVTTLTGTGATGTGAQRVTVATDSATVAGSATLPAGTNVIGHVITDTNSTTAVTGTVTTQTTGNTAVLSGQQAVTGSAVVLATNAAKTVCIHALAANTINVYLGPTGITTSTGMELPPGTTYCAPASNTNLFFVIASTTGASVSWITSN